MEQYYPERADPDGIRPTSKLGQRVALARDRKTSVLSRTNFRGARGTTRRAGEVYFAKIGQTQKKP